MKIETKFNLNQMVYPIRQSRRAELILCPTCEGIGEVVILPSGKKIICPDCYGKGGHNAYRDLEWHICHDIVSKVGKVDVEVYANEGDNKNRTAYMIESTGIGSGSVWNEENLFATEEEANMECEKRNSKVNANE